MSEVRWKKALICKYRHLDIQLVSLGTKVN